ncbi:hypothetical protein [Archaeoglobus veneficus]|uniref:Uncharacterized protein n=1 Tax=Archaeoglobus veneficus (strain DSM 11195 / SNP6) TaxID=693661 RepID=F2KRI6_ARCVS|nr:hypothetical protein [Archaeoglobus veneficus]AEA46751.1 hypothetical protein Arcve_0733 [Archaeoglobus veneficus SNP6]
MTSALAIHAGAIILTVMIMGIVLGYTGGIAIDLAGTITDLTFQTATLNFINEAGTLGFSILKFNFLTAIGFIAFGVLGMFLYARYGAGEGAV